MRITRILALVPLLLVPSFASAAPIYIGDGGNHDVNTATNATYQVQNGTLNLLPGADVSYVSGSGDPVLIAMSGGRVASGIAAIHGNVTISGGETRGYASPSFGGDGLTVFQGTANITGGLFVGGDAPGQAGSGVVGSAGTASGQPALSTLNIGGGTFQGGTGSGGFYGGTTGYSLISIGNTTVTGGNFLSPIAINTALGGETAFLGSNLSFQDHILSGVLLNGDAIHVRVYPDVADATVNDAATEVRFRPTAAGGLVLGSPVPVPEPAPALIFGLIAALGLAHRRSRRAGSAGV